jgi:hypothetical protein
MLLAAATCIGEYLAQFTGELQPAGQVFLGG